ncbi:MAG: hypothetical protein AB7H97_15030, partial [Pseudobdellovibrionaceae bacterium]
MEYELAFRKRVRNIPDIGAKLLAPSAEKTALISTFLQKTNATGSYAEHYSLSYVVSLLEHGGQSLVRPTKS